MKSSMSNKRNKPLIMGHRGIPWSFPENSILSFEKAIWAGVDILEFDVRLTKDNIPIIIHDATIDRTTDGIGDVISLTYEEIQQYKIIFTKTGKSNNPQPIPTLYQLLELITQYPNIILNCELKNYSLDCLNKTLQLISSFNLLARTIFTCFDYHVLEILKTINNQIKIQGFPLELMTNVPNDLNNSAKFFDYIGIKDSLITKKLVSYYASLGIHTGVWVINNEEDYLAAIDNGVEIITTDRADFLIQIKERNQQQIGEY